MKRQGALLLCVGVLMISAFLYLQFNTFNRDVEALELPTASFAGLADGAYTGSYSLDPYVVVEVVLIVRSEQVTEIKLLRHENGRGEAAERLLDRVIETNQLPVDVVSGATASSKALMYAIADAVETVDED